jgi:MscS family membrane protein
MEILREIVSQHEGAEDKVLVSFNAFGDFAMNILFIYYIKKGGDILGVQSDVNMAILRRFNEAGLEFAFPTQTLYTKQA